VSEAVGRRAGESVGEGGQVAGGGVVDFIEQTKIEKTGQAIKRTEVKTARHVRPPVNQPNYIISKARAIRTRIPVVAHCSAHFQFTCPSPRHRDLE
jgi:hypothetical protein